MEQVPMKTKEIKLSVLVKQETKDFNVCFVLLKKGKLKRIKSWLHSH